MADENLPLVAVKPVFHMITSVFSNNVQAIGMTIWQKYPDDWDDLYSLDRIEFYSDDWDDRVTKNMKRSYGKYENTLRRSERSKAITLILVIGKKFGLDATKAGEIQKCSNRLW